MLACVLLLWVSLHAAGDVEGEEDAHGDETHQRDHQEQWQDVLPLKCRYIIFQQKMHTEHVKA